MGNESDRTIEVTITNPLGFHVRPIQRFAELAQAFCGEVHVEANDRAASGKSTMGLMSLGAGHGTQLRIRTDGEDAEQALGVLGALVENDFFVEAGTPGRAPDRHLKRLVQFASCFESDVRVEVDGQCADARNFEELSALGLGPDSRVVFHVEGEDAEQARKVLENLVRRRFYVEDETTA